MGNLPLIRTALFAQYDELETLTENKTVSEIEGVDCVLKWQDDVTVLQIRRGRRDN